MRGARAASGLFKTVLHIVVSTCEFEFEPFTLHLALLLGTSCLFFVHVIFSLLFNISSRLSAHATLIFIFCSRTACLVGSQPVRAFSITGNIEYVARRSQVTHCASHLKRPCALAPSGFLESVQWARLLTAAKLWPEIVSFLS